MRRLPARAVCFAAAGKQFYILDPNIAADRKKLTKLFRCGDSGANRGAELLARAVLNG